MPDAQDEPGKEEEVMSEIIERAMEANVKILVGNEIAHANRVGRIAEQSLQDAIDYRRKADDQYLGGADERAKESLANTQDKRENQRFTLDRLYGMFPEEAAGTSALLKLIIDALKSQGWTPPPPPATP